MADVAEVDNEFLAIEKELEKKVEQTEEEPKVSENGGEKPKENGSTENGDAKEEEEEEEEETNGDVIEVTGIKRKSGAGDATDGTPVEGSPEKKAKLSQEEKGEETEATNGEAQVVA